MGQAKQKAELAKERAEKPGNIFIAIANVLMAFTAPIWAGWVVLWIFLQSMYFPEGHEKTKAAEFRRGYRRLWNG